MKWICNFDFLLTIQKYITSKYEICYAKKINLQFYMKIKSMEQFQKDLKLLKSRQRNRHYNICSKERLIEPYLNILLINNHLDLILYLLLFQNENPNLNHQIKLLFQNFKLLIWLVRKELRKRILWDLLYKKQALLINHFLIQNNWQFH